MTTLKELSHKEELLTGGHRLCAGCGASIAVRSILLAADAPVVSGVATGCLEVSTTIYPYTAWRTSLIHNAFENCAATVTGVETAYRSLKKQGKLPADRELRFAAFGGDGSSYDIGFQSLSGALERGHKFVYVCYNNEAYMNTGIQRSGATPLGTWTTTTPVGAAHTGKEEHHKDLTFVAAAHDIPYVAQASVSHPRDLINKAEKAFQANGPAFLNVLAPCPRGWRHESNLTVEVAKTAVETKIWPLYEIENGEWKLNNRPKKDRPIEEYFAMQGRYKHLTAPANAEIVEAYKKEVARKWSRLMRMCGEKE